MNQATLTKRIACAVRRLERDITDRRGLSSEWEGIDADIKSEIRRAWRNIIADAIAGVRFADGLAAVAARQRRHARPN